MTGAIGGSATDVIAFAAGSVCFLFYLDATEQTTPRTKAKPLRVKDLCMRMDGLLQKNKHWALLLNRARRTTAFALASVLS
jgi:hypothetical protein